MTKFWLKKNWMYILVFFICIAIFFYGVLEEKSIFEILKRAIFEDGYKERFFQNNEDATALAHIKPTVFNVMRYALSEVQYTLDVAIIFGTMWFQIIIPLFATVSGIAFYRSYNSIFHFEFYRSKNKYRKFIIKKILLNALKLAGTIFVAYLIFLIYIKTTAIPDRLGSEGRTLFADLFGNGLFLDYTFIYFILEGMIRFLLIPFVYAMLAQSIVLLGKSLKEIIAVPILYYYGLSAFGYALDLVSPALSIYFNPTAIMANGTYESFNTIIMILMNLAPLYLALGIIFWSSKNVEI